MSDGTRPDTPVKDMLTVEIAAYAVLAVLAGVGLALGTAVGGGPSPVCDPCMAVGVLALAVALLVCSPLREGVAGRAIAGVTGLAALALVVAEPLLGPVVFDGAASSSSIEAWSQDRRMLELWLAMAGGLLVVLVVASFVRQMGRAERSHLIRGLSHTVLAGVALIAATGWYFLPRFMVGLTAGGADGGDTGGNVMVWAGAAVLLVAVGAALAVASVWWLREADPEPGAKAPWVGVGLLAVMMTGAFVPVLALIAVLV